MITLLNRLKMNFNNQKKMALSKIDKSRKGSIDRKIKPLIGLINKNRHYFTTSSCSGRIALIEDGKKHENAVLWQSHDVVDDTASVEILEHIRIKHKERGILWLKVEPCMITLISSSIEKASEIVNLAKEAGWKKSGFSISRKGRIIVELASTENLAIPLSTDEKILKFFIEEANKKLRKTHQKIKRFLRFLK